MKYPIGIQSFEEIRLGGYVYVDKTDLVYEMASSSKYCFLSRPRRFGKSLLLSTFDAYFSGRKDLFEGLALGNLEKEWKAYPVLHFDLNAGKYDSIEGLNELLDNQLSRYEEIYDCQSNSASANIRLSRLIEKAAQAKGRNVVVLVDEYEKPLLETIGNDSLQEEMRAILKPFYANLKTCDSSIRFALLTGVSKLGHLSVFSDLNNIEDLSMVSKYASICGITHDEFSTNFGEQVSTLSHSWETSEEEVKKMFSDMYDGYRFSLSSVRVLNPFSTLLALKREELSNFWFQTGTPSYLVKMLKMHQYDLWHIENEERTTDKLQSIDSVSRDPIPLLYQSGYLTIKDYDPKFRTFRLGFPDNEVREGFVNMLLPYYTDFQQEKTEYS